MPNRYRAALSLSLAAVVLGAASCGTLIHPERVGQPRGGRLDVSIVLLDGLGLFFFFIPGVVAFVVDFGTGAIYLPPGYGDSGGDGDPARWRVVTVPKDELDRGRIEEVVAREAGRPIDLGSDAVRVERLESIDDAPAALRPRRPAALTARARPPSPSEVPPTTTVRRRTGLRVAPPGRETRSGPR